MFMYVYDGLLDMYCVWINYVCSRVKSASVRTPLHCALCTTAQNTQHLQTFLKNPLFPTTDDRQWQHAKAVGGRKFFGGLISTFVFDIFKIHRGGGGVGILHTGAILATDLPACNVFHLLGHYKSSEVWGANTTCILETYKTVVIIRTTCCSIKKQCYLPTQCIRYVIRANVTISKHGCSLQHQSVDNYNGDAVCLLCGTTLRIRINHVTVQLTCTLLSILHLAMHRSVNFSLTQLYYTNKFNFSHRASSIQDRRFIT